MDAGIPKGKTEIEGNDGQEQMSALNNLFLLSK
jgi:hypothetical protein